MVFGATNGNVSAPSSLAERSFSINARVAPAGLMLFNSSDNDEEGTDQAIIPPSDTMRRVIDLGRLG